MSTSKRIAFGAGAQWISRFSSIALGLVLMPVLLDHLPKEEVGLWLLLGQSWAVMGILDLGFSAVLTRRIALAKGRSGGGADVDFSEESLHEIADLVTMGRRVYRYMAFGVFAVSWALGFYYLRNLELHEVSHRTVWTAWSILCASNAFNVWGQVWVSLLQGTGHVGWDGLLASALGSVTLLAQIVAVWLGGGLVVLATIAAVGAIAQRFILRRFSLRKNTQIDAIRGSWNRELFRPMPGLAVRAWFTSIGGVLVFNTDGFFIAASTTAADIPAYRAAFLVTLNLHVLASALAQASWVFMSQLWQAGQHEEVRRVFQRNLRAGLCFMICGGVAVIAAGDSLFNVWLGPGNYVGPSIIGVLVLLFILEQQSYIVATGCRATELEPFAFWMMAAAVLKLASSPFLLAHFGLIGLAVSNLLAQGIAVYWVVLRKGLHRLGFGWQRYLKEIALPCLIVLVAAGVLCGLAASLVRDLRSFWQLVSVSATSAVVLGAASWMLVLSASQRSRLLGGLRTHLLKGRAA